MGLQHVTVEVAHALRSCDYVDAASKTDNDELLAIRAAICDVHDVELVAVPDPMRDREPANYPAPVAAWHDARAAAYAEVIGERRGVAAFLVWGDPSPYDSTIHVVERVAESVGAEWDVLPGVSAPSLLPARHRIVLHEVGQPVHITSARRLHEVLGNDQINIVVMLGNEADLTALVALAEWSIWWGPTSAPAPRSSSRDKSRTCWPISSPRARARQTAGWVMDVYLLRAPA